MSAVHTASGCSTLKLCASRLGATGKVCRSVGGRYPEAFLTLDAAQAQLTPYPLDRAETGDEAVGSKLFLQPHRAVSLARPRVRGACR